MPRVPIHMSLGQLLLAVLLPACTDWNAQGNVPAEAPHLQQLGSPQLGSPQLADAGATDALPGLTVWETWTPPPVDVAHPTDVLPGDDATATQDAEDAGESPDVAVALDSQTADGTDAAVVDAAVMDAAVVDAAVADVDPACIGNAKVLGCPCASSAQCASGLCTLAPAGPVCSESCAKTGCPDGWLCSAVAKVCKPVAVPDAGSLDADSTGLQDVAAADASASDASEDAALPDAPANDAVDAVLADVDVVQADGAIEAGAGSADTVAADTVAADAAAADSGASDATSSDAALTDSIIVDVTSSDAGSGDAIGVDWQGYPDASFPDGADIYGGPINSCLAVYLFQQENCGKNSPTSACISAAGQAGSLYANYLFDPLGACEKAACVPTCQGATDGTCMEKCVGKYCATQFLGCVANDSSGANDCANAFTCAGKYPDKLLTIASACYANATPVAQKQMAALIGCSGAPQTSSCLPEIAACYKSANPQASCKDVATCTSGCGSDQTCVWTCIGTANLAALQKIAALGECQAACKTQCNGSQTCVDACNSQQCGGQVADCLGN
jgi:hypothetical protein